MARFYIIIAALLGLMLICGAASGETIAEAKQALDGVTVVVQGCVTTASYDECYIESTNRISGIWVKAGMADVSVGEIVTVTGIMATINGERVIQRANVYPTGSMADIRPFTMLNRAIGGKWFGYQDCASDVAKLYDQKKGWQYWWIPSMGVNNTGLLITTYGRVTATYYSPVGSTHWFYVDDGFGATADGDDTGILVYSDADVRIGDFVTVTGISSVECSQDDGLRLIRAIRPRSVADVNVAASAEPAVPFSDEFNKETLDPRWAIVAPMSMELYKTPASIGTVSTANEPGWLELAMPEQTNASHYYYNSYYVVQVIKGDWDMEIKLRLVADKTHTCNQGVTATLTNDTLGQIHGLLPTQFASSPNVLAALFTSGYTVKFSPTYAQVIGMNSTPIDPSDTVYFRVRKRGGTVYGSMSFDGVNYGPEYARTGASGCYFVISAYADGSSGWTPETKAYCDYVRFTRVSEGQ